MSITYVDSEDCMLLGLGYYGTQCEGDNNGLDEGRFGKSVLEARLRGFNGVSGGGQVRGNIQVTGGGGEGREAEGAREGGEAERERGTGAQRVIPKEEVQSGGTREEERGDTVLVEDLMNSVFAEFMK